MNAITLDYVSPNCSNINFLHNLFVECGNIDLGGTGPTANTWANNIFQRSSGSIFLNDNTGTAWVGNIGFGTLGITIPSGMTSADPLLVLDSAGYYGLASNSPAIDASSANYPPILSIANVDDDPSVLLDISGQARPASRTLKDVGCDEFGTNGTLNRPLALSDVGPSYLGGPSGTMSPSIATQPQSQTVSAGATVTLWVAATGTAPLSYQWLKNGTNVVGASAATNSIAAAQITDAGHYAVVVANAAGSVTSDVATLSVVIVPPQITSIALETDRSFALSGTGPMGAGYRILAATNIASPFGDWLVVDTGVFNGGVFTFTDTQATNLPQRFYRVVTP